MGNEKSQLSGVSIVENAVQVTENWVLHSATHAASNSTKISIFIGLPEVQSTSSPLERFTKNLMLYRHPCILKYVSSWKKGGKLHLATEDVRPLSQVVTAQTPLQICIGLHNVLKALVFLHDTGSSSHNNVCQAAVYVTNDGYWKLGGLEFLCRFIDLNSQLLRDGRPGRYELAISPHEQNQVPQPPASIDQYAFFVLAKEILSGHTDEEVPGLVEFLDLCRCQTQCPDNSERPSLNSLLLHPFYTHHFINIHNFLTELPLKTDAQKYDFFRELRSKLSQFPEELVASQLGSLLLSRLVLLDATAQQHFLPYILAPRSEEAMYCLFSETTFRAHTVPRLVCMFCVRDSQIRQLLLSHFAGYCSFFSHIQLQTRILPELLVGIKDTSDALVSSTLRALADLVPLLGASVVIGGKRGKLFSDGRPKPAHRTSKADIRRLRQSRQLETDSPGHLLEGMESLPEERPSPDGGEDYQSPTISEEETEPWPDWEDSALSQIDSVSNSGETVAREFQQEEISGARQNLADHSEEQLFQKKTEFLLEFDPNHSNAVADKRDSTKCSMAKVLGEIDFFEDMEPVISPPPILHVLVPQSEEETYKFAVSEAPGEMAAIAEGWGSEDLDDWEGFVTTLPLSTRQDGGTETVAQL